MASHQLCGTGGFSQCAGSERPFECAGITRVPESVTASIRARTTATGPPQTQPSELREECTITATPGATPSRRSSPARLGRVRGDGVLAITSRSFIERNITVGVPWASILGGERRKLGVASVPDVGFVGGVRRRRRTAGEEGEDRGPGPEQGEAVEDEGAEDRDQVRDGDDECTDHGGQRVARAVASGGEHHLAPHEEGRHERPEEEERQVCRRQEHQERYPHEGDREHHAEDDDRRHGGYPEEQRPTG